MKLTTPVTLPTDLPKLDHRQTLVLMGSCFASGMGDKLRAAKFNCTVNPYGVLYNPLSIATSLHELLEGRIYTADDLYEADGLWHSPMHHGSFSTPSAERTLQLINLAGRRGHEALLHADRLLLTFGTAYVYCDRATGRVVGNCHRLPSDRFERRRLTVDEVVTRCSATLSRLLSLRPELQVVMTVSPVRHLRDGLHDNQLSKSVLLLAADQLCRANSRVHYFPAYEIVMDELRDYRYYADNLTHPSSLAIEYVWQRFTEASFSEPTRRLAETCTAIRLTLDHRPLHPDTPAYDRLLKQTLDKIAELQRQYPYLDFETEIAQCHHTALTR